MIAGFRVRGAPQIEVCRAEGRDASSAPVLARGREALRKGMEVVRQSERAVSFSLFGNSPIYLAGALRNAELVPSVYPGWKAVFFCGNEVPVGLKRQLEALGAEVRGPVQGISDRVFDRLCLFDDPRFDAVIVRDCDSRVSSREAEAVMAWMGSDKAWHVMKDHPFHMFPMMTGMIGVKRGAVNGFTAAILKSGMADSAYIRGQSYGRDQEFLAKNVWPVAKQSVLHHVSCGREKWPGSVDFPSPMKFGEHRFVGEIVEAEDRPRGEHWMMRCNWMKP